MARRQRRSNRDPQSRWKGFFFTDNPLVFIRAGSLFFILVGFAAMILFALGATSSTNGFFTAVASAFAFALASGATGSLGGFIFGVPRSHAGARTETDTGGAPTDGNTEIIPNTNLEQISDWLTKVIVGATLVQLTNIPSAAARLFTAMAPALGGGDSGAAFAGAIVIYFAVTAFILGWLYTRLYLGNLMRDADVRRSIEMSNKARASGKDDEADRWLQRAQNLVARQSPVPPPVGQGLGQPEVGSQEPPH